MIRPLAIVLLSASCALAQQQSQPPKRGGANAQNPQSNQPPAQPAINLTVTVPQPSPEETAKEAQNRDREIAAEEDVRDFTRWLTYLTVAQAIIGILGFVVSRKAANAAKKAADVAEQSLVATTRAFVIPMAPMAQGVVLDGVQSVMLSVIYKNEGTTPALDVIQSFNIIQSDSKPTIDVLFGKPPDPGVSSIIGPRVQAVSNNAHIPVSSLRPDAHSFAQTGKTASPASHLYCFGWIAYRDAFGDPHVAQHCWKLANFGAAMSSPDFTYEQALKSNKLIFQWEQVGDYNRVDEGCQLHDRIVALLPRPSLKPKKAR